ncbi:MAG TPA: pilin [Patescibacteria group bacterium]|nr:pilin [Patescibacteria group bacterium]
MITFGQIKQLIQPLVIACIALVSLLFLPFPVKANYFDVCCLCHPPDKSTSIQACVVIPIHTSTYAPQAGLVATPNFNGETCTPDSLKNSIDEDSSLSDREKELRKKQLSNIACSPIANDVCTLHSSSNLKGVCPSEPRLLNDWLTSLPTQGLEVQVAKDIITPQLGVPIPGLTFSSATQQDDYLSIPFLGDYIAAVYRYAVGISVILAIIMVVYGGFRYLIGSAAGDVKKGRTIIVDAIAGMLITLCAYLILHIANPSTLNLDAIRLPIVYNVPEAKAEPEGTEQELKTCTPINSLDHYDADGNASAINALTETLSASRINDYKKAANAVGIPWEVLASVHMMEGPGGSTLNGSSYCNKKDDPDLLTWCSRCSVATQENDYYCGALKLARANAGLNKSNLNAVKLAFCRYNGCNKARQACPELSPYVAAYFDAAHVGYVKSGVDCLTTSCKDGQVTDITQKKNGKSPGVGGCTLKFYKAGQEPSGYNPGGSKCQNIQIWSPCCSNDPSNQNVMICTYHPGTRNSTNKCGNSVPQPKGKPGALLYYAAILDLEKKGKIQP